MNNDACIDGFKRELPTYTAAATDVNPDIDALTWWGNHEKKIPNWAKACKKIFLIQPSSAASERVLSLLQNAFLDSRACAMEDYIAASIMLQYNRQDDRIKGIRILYVADIIINISISTDCVLF